MHIVYLEDGTKKIMKLPNIVAVYGSDGKIQNFENGLTNDGEEFPPDIDDIGFSSDGVNFSNLESITGFPIDVIYYNNNERIERKKNTDIEKNKINITGKNLFEKSYEDVNKIIETYNNLVDIYNDDKYDVENINEINKNIELLKNNTEIKKFKDLFDNYKIVEITIDNNLVNKTFFDENVNNIIERFEKIIKNIEDVEQKNRLAEEARLAEEKKITNDKSSEGEKIADKKAARDTKELTTLQKEDINNIKTEFVKIYNEFDEIEKFLKNNTEFLKNNTDYENKTRPEKVKIYRFAIKYKEKLSETPNFEITSLYSLVQNFKKNYIEFTIDDKVINSNYFDEFIKKYSENLDKLINNLKGYFTST